MSNQDKNSNNPPPPNDRSRRQVPPGTSRAALVWLIVSLLIGGLLLFKNYAPRDVKPLKQSEFEELLGNGRVNSAVIVNDSDSIYDIEGKYTPEHGEKSLDYRTKVIYSDALAELLKKKLNDKRITTVEVKSNNAGFWHIFWVGIVPVLLIGGLIYFISMRQMRMSGHNALDFGKSKARMIPPDELNVKFDDIAGADEAKEEIAEAMNAAIAGVKSFSVTYAARDSSFDGLQIKEGEYLALQDGKLICNEADKDRLTAAIGSALADCGAEFVSIFYGEDVAADEAEAFSEAIGKQVPDAEISLVSGGQPVYYYLISAE